MNKLVSLSASICSAFVLVSLAVVPLAGCAPTVVCPEVVVEQSSASSGAEVPAPEVSNHELHAALTQLCSAFTLSLIHI